MLVNLLHCIIKYLVAKAKIITDLSKEISETKWKYIFVIVLNINI